MVAELAVRESEEFDRLFWDKQVDQRAYEHQLRSMLNDPQFREILA